jgi:hypothetical protein
VANNRTQYTIDFVYEDNGQPFSTGALMDTEEAASMQRVLDAYEQAGAIKHPSIYQPFSADQTFDVALGEIMSALEHEVPDSEDLSVCQNCETEWPTSILPAVQDITQRVSPGEPMPSGECPSCGAVCHPQAVKA